MGQNPELSQFGMSRRAFLQWLCLLATAPMGLALARPEKKSIQKPETFHLSPLPGGNFWFKDLQTGKSRTNTTGASSLQACPGSIMKLVSAATLLEHHLVTPEASFHCTGTYHSRNANYYCQYPHGKVTLDSALGYSCNGYFAHMANRSLTPRLFLNTLSAITGQTALDETIDTRDGETAPLLALGLHPNLTVGGGQLIGIAEAVATRKLPGKNPPRWQASTWSHLTAGMRMAARLGTGQYLDPKDTLKIALKTGTVPRGKQSEPGIKSSNAYQSWVIGFFPVDRPRYVFCVQALQGTSQDAAIPAARQLLGLAAQ